MSALGRVLAAALALTASASHADPSSRISGQVQVAGEPASGWTVELRAGNPAGSAELDTTVSGGNGNFAVRSAGVRPGSILYVIASRGDQFAALEKDPYAVDPTRAVAARPSPRSRARGIREGIGATDLLLSGQVDGGSSSRELMLRNHV